MPIWPATTLYEGGVRMTEMNRNNIRIDPMLEVDTKWNWPYIYAEIQLLLDGGEKFRISSDETLGLYASYSPVFRTVELEYFIEDE